jgi:integral membrane protein (TIGR01906 family)
MARAPAPRTSLRMLILSRLAAVLFIVSVPVFIVTANIRWLAGDISYYQHGFREYDSDARTGLSFEELDAAGQRIINYFEDDSRTLRIIINVNGEEDSLFNARETEHMKDVKSLMRFLFRLNEVSLAVIITYIAGAVLWSNDRSIRGLAKLSLAGVAFGVAVVGIIGAFALTGFDEAWNTFHEIAFTNDLWRLDPDTDRLIQMFPEPFWEEATLIVGGLVLAQATVIVLLSLGYLVFARERRTPVIVEN